MLTALRGEAVEIGDARALTPRRAQPRAQFFAAEAQGGSPAIIIGDAVQIDGGSALLRSGILNLAHPSRTDRRDDEHSTSRSASVLPHPATEPSLANSG